MDEAGLHIGLEVDTHRAARYPKYLKHTNLSMRAAIGGEVWFHADGKTVTIDADSGRFGLETNAARHSGSLTHAQWDATVQLWQSLGYTIVSTQEVFSELPDPAWKPKARPHETKSWKSQPRLIEPRESKATGKAPTRSSTRARLPIEPKIPGSGLVERRSTARLLNVRLLVESLRQPDWDGIRKQLSEGRLARLEDVRQLMRALSSHLDTGAARSMLELLAKAVPKSADRAGPDGARRALASVLAAALPWIDQAKKHPGIQALVSALAGHLGRKPAPDVWSNAENCARCFVELADPDSSSSLDLSGYGRGVIQSFCRAYLLDGEGRAGHTLLLDPDDLEWAEALLHRSGIEHRRVPDRHALMTGEIASTLNDMDVYRLSGTLGARIVTIDNPEILARLGRDELSQLLEAVRMEESDEQGQAVSRLVDAVDIRARQLAGLDVSGEEDAPPRAIDTRWMQALSGDARPQVDAAQMVDPLHPFGDELGRAQRMFDSVAEIKNTMPQTLAALGCEGLRTRLSIVRELNPQNVDSAEQRLGALEALAKAVILWTQSMKSHATKPPSGLNALFGELKQCAQNVKESQSLYKALLAVGEMR